MSNTGPQSPHFYLDENTGKWTSVEPSALPKVLVLAWHADPSDLAAQIQSSAGSLLAELIPVPGESVTEMLGELRSKQVVACVLFVSPVALNDEGFATFIHTCKDLFLERREFRLFVQLADGLTFDRLKEAADNDPESAPGELIDSVHLSSRIQGDLSATVQMLKKHLLELPKTLHRLNRETWEARWSAILALIVGALRLVLLLAVGLLLIKGPALPDQQWLPWLFFCWGLVLYVALVNLLSLGSRLTSGSIVRWFLILGPLALGYLLPLNALAASWPYLLAGALSSVVIDVCVRALARWKRLSLQIKGIPKDVQHESKLPGKRSHKFITSGPWFPGPAKIFVSYSERSDWGRRVAADLHTKLEEQNVVSFFAPKSIEHGSSWRHRLNSEMWSANTFVQFLDDKTSYRDRYWPAVELAVASAHQLISGLPSIIIVCHPSMSQESLPEDSHPYIKKVLLAAGNAVDSSLWALNYEEDVESRLANELAQRYRWQAVSILQIKFAAILELLLMAPATLLGLVGVLGSIAIAIAVLVALVMWIQDESLIGWLITHGYGLIGLMIAAYWLGFVLRLAVSARLEVWDKASGNSFMWRALEIIGLSTFCYYLGQSASPIVLVYAGLCCAFGPMMAAHYMRRAAEAKGWVKS